VYFLTHLGWLEHIALLRVLIGLSRRDAVDSDEELEEYDHKAAQERKSGSL